MLFANCWTTFFVSFPSKRGNMRVQHQARPAKTLDAPFMTMCVSFKISAAAIRASSWVNLSNRFRASSISFFPTSFFRNFSETSLATIKYRLEQRTRSSLSHFLRSNCEDVQHLDHDLHDYVRHCVCWRYCSIRLEPLEEVLDTFKEIDEGLLAGLDIFGRL
jgi:hypothetical protein